MPLADKALINGSWFAALRSVSQIISWVATIVIARLLSPVDYALSAMATLITGYAELLSEMGLGASIIQRENQSQKDLSSVFWFSLGIGCLFALACFPIAYLTAHIFDEPDVIPLVFSVSVMFIFTGLIVVPLSLLKRDMNYKQVGLIEMKATIFSCLSMVVIAYFDGGVWTLIGGRIIRGGVRVVLVYRAVNWRPSIYYDFGKAKEYIKFGVMVAFSSSVYYVFEMSDRFFAGRSWEAEALGFYLLALQLAAMPTEKIVSTINQVTYSLFSRYQYDMPKFREYYLGTIKLTALLVFPIFTLGFLLGEDLINVVLGEKWLPMSTLFEYLCLIQIGTSICAVAAFAHMALGKPVRNVFYATACAVGMSISFYIAVGYPEKEMILVPWFTTYLSLVVCWIGYTNWKIRLRVIDYLENLIFPVFGSILVAASVLLISELFDELQGASVSLSLMLKCLAAIIVYTGFIWIFDRDSMEKYRSFMAERKMKKI